MVIEEKIGHLLAGARLTLAVAESCTGGLLAHRVTRVPGSSAYFRGGVVAYHNDVKQDLLRVPEKVLREEGAVSRSTALAMAQGVRDLLGASIGLACTGIAGPGGGTATKPVGLTYVALSTHDGLEACEEHRWSGTRQENQESAAEATLRLLYACLAERRPALT
ncbi:MAG: CinA family protein [Chloroflexi bacterium]|nr:CinA family protein [Chloroflexota bacterium]